MAPGQALSDVAGEYEEAMRTFPARLQASVLHLPRGLPAREYHIRMIMSETCQRRLC